MQFPAKVSRQSSPRKLVLCIDDNKKVLHARKLVLEMAGYKVITASSGGRVSGSSNGIPFNL